ncbi:MAG: hypothetical protein JNL74_07495 [Fibrobacteres bacterium]|nr:hypothetical protein [Fibrobacterota bacterium]
MRSLINVLDEINESFFYSRPITKENKRIFSNFIASRQGQPGAYNRMFFAPTADDDMSHYKLFTGETPSRLSALHIVGEECCRALLKLGVNDSQSKLALEKASSSVLGAYSRYRTRTGKRSFPKAFFCCPKCTCGFWRHLSARVDDQSEEYLSDGMDALKSWRNGKGGWNMFPQHYTLLALTEMDSKKVKAELKYAAKFCEEELSKVKRISLKFPQRRLEVMKRVLELI